jgi:hypothetical protein
MLQRFLTLSFLFIGMYSASGNHARPNHLLNHPKNVPNYSVYAGESIGIYIDEKGNSKLIKDDMNGLPDEFQNELKNYKLCLVKFDKVDAGMITKKLDEAMRKWDEVYGNYKKQLEKDEADIDKKYKEEFDGEDKTKDNEMKTAENTHKTNDENIKKSGKKPVDITADLEAEKKRYSEEREKINNKWKKAKSDSQKKKDKEISDAKAKKPTAPKLPFDMSCAPNPKVECSKECEMHEAHEAPTEKKEIMIQKIELGSVDKLHAKHFYFCTCGKK